jgi:hypothetical protein
VRSVLAASPQDVCARLALLWALCFLAAFFLAAFFLAARALFWLAAWEAVDVVSVLVTVSVVVVSVVVVVSDVVAVLVVGDVVVVGGCPPPGPPGPPSPGTPVQARATPPPPARDSTVAAVATVMRGNLMSETSVGGWDALKTRPDRRRSRSGFSGFV